MHKDLWSLKITVPERDEELLEAILAMNISYGWEEQGGSADAQDFLVHNEKRFFLEELAGKIKEALPAAIFVYEKLEQTDFLENWKEFFTPVYCGENYVIVPPWLAKEAHDRKYQIVIDPKSAFGTGHHATTTLCLKALDELLNSGRIHAGQNFLDLGCGTGVLGIGAVLAGLHGICIDIDPLAVENARENSSINHANTAIKCLEGSIGDLAGKTFDLVMANILAEPLISMASDICSCLARSGCLILSGILAMQAREVSDAYMRCGLSEAATLVDGEWCALIWFKT